MSEKKSLLVDKIKMPLAMGLAFVAFTTQFGGGFASGAQIYQYFINYVMHTNTKHTTTEVFQTACMVRPAT